MSATLDLNVLEPSVVHFEPEKLRMNDEEFFDFCQLNQDLRIEQSSKGDIIVMAPTGAKTGLRKARLTSRVLVWAENDSTGQVFDSSTIFSLPNGAKRSPDVAWVRNERWNALSAADQERFAPLCPDFVVELRSKTDRLKTLQAKMEEYITTGVQLGWLIDPVDRKVHVYRPGVEPEILDDPETVSGEPLMNGFVLDVRSLWD